jgi:glycosyltransferase involved in cell wall biosynthesis
VIVGLFTELEATGGLQRSGRHMAAVLVSFARQRKVTCQLFSLNEPLGKHRAYVGDFAFQFAGLSGSICSKWRYMRALIATVRCRPFLILVAHSHIAPIAWFIKRLNGAKVIVFGHGSEVRTPLSPIRRLSLQQADLVLANSRDTAKRVVQVQHVAPSKVDLMPLALEPAFWQAAQGKFSADLPSGFPSGRVLLSVGRLERYTGNKGVDMVIQVLPQIIPEVPDVQYVVVGDGDDLARLKRIRDAIGVADRVHFLGELSGQQLMSCYHNCEVFVLPSSDEGFGLVFLEAMAFGKVVIGGKHTGAADIIEDGRNGLLVSYGDISQLTASLMRLLTDERLRQTMGAQGREQVRTHYLYDTFQVRLTTFIESVLATQDLR